MNQKKQGSDWQQQDASCPQSYSFSDMKLKVGDKLQLQPPPSVSNEKFTVKLLGYLDHMSVLITAPASHGLTLPLLKGERIVVRAFSGQHAFGFVSTIAHICKSPFEYLHISFPESIEGLTIRRSPRVQTMTPASIIRKSPGSEPISCLINNLSLTGAMVSSESPLGQKSEVVSLAFKLSALGISSVISVESIIRSVSETPSAKGTKAVHHGLEFRQMGTNERLLLGSYIYEQTS